MTIWEIIIIGIAMAMDATAVSLTDGMIECKMTIKKASFIAITFGVFQGIMPIFGYYSGTLFADFISEIDHYVAFVILIIFGIKMIYESNKQEETDNCGALSKSKIILQGIATSIDALIIGITFAIYKVRIYYAGFIIMLITIIFCFLGVMLGRQCGKVLKNKAEILGGLILIIIGIKILIEGIH